MKMNKRMNENECIIRAIFNWTLLKTVYMMILNANIEEYLCFIKKKTAYRIKMYTWIPSNTLYLVLAK